MLDFWYCSDVANQIQMARALPSKCDFNSTCAKVKSNRQLVGFCQRWYSTDFWWKYKKGTMKLPTISTNSLESNWRFKSLNFKKQWFKNNTVSGMSWLWDYCGECVSNCMSAQLSQPWLPSNYILNPLFVLLNNSHCVLLLGLRSIVKKKAVLPAFTSG